MSAEDTKTRILDTAQELFATQGFGPTSLRNVTAAAGVNLAAVHYHFGSKDELVRAVFARFIDPLNEQRLLLLDDLEKGASGQAQARLPVEDILQAFVQPVMRLAEHDAPGRLTLMALVGRVHNESNEHLRSLVFDLFRETAARYLATLERALPNVPQDELCTRFHFAIGAMGGSLVDPERLVRLSEGRVDPHDTRTLLSRLIVFLAAGLSAPVDGVSENPS